VNGVLLVIEEFLKYHRGMSDVTQILSKIESGDQKASAELLPLVYDELRKLAASRMASERPDHTLQSTALVHEAYLRLVDVNRVQHWDSRGHFFAAAAEAMRRILVDSARSKKTLKRGGGREKLELDDNIEDTITTKPDLLLELSDALEKLAEEDHKAAELFKLRVFAGLSMSEAGEMLGMSERTAYDNWTFARSWLSVCLNESDG
jgi:RNA polymerase sigma factor (TIGR02999 family)